ncbi:ABC transporter ATP-binding protein [Paenibacillus prosopidis]|uniref:Iron complex transport system ATP-binding protein n=1 Tax=Paenibacillus prosopidis TaxID=630520 RepID=A0A368W777_9BACL|nr:ABC transporter ATP-binding protein [Paenibacillus prosopidis]RCW51268.1 iron complex transport system ATP-binding protein [Paenibacillus prosopidis]
MIIDINNVSWDRGDKTILHKIDWQVRNGEHWCLLGLNGSGKTTLLNMINGYIWPTDGKMSVLGQTFGEFDLRELRKRIGWVSTSLQQKLYGSETALKIVLSGKFATIGLYDQTDEEDLNKAESLLRSLGCAALITRTYDTLSQGERQRVLIARALMASPKLLILDEPCTGLDVFAREQLLHMITAVAEQKEAPTIVYVTHHVEEILPCFSKTLLIKDGQVFAAKETADVLTSATMSEFFGVPVQIERQLGRNWLSVKGDLWN